MRTECNKIKSAARLHIIITIFVNNHRLYNDSQNFLAHPVYIHKRRNDMPEFKI